MSLKQDVHEYCRKLVAERLADLQRVLEELLESAANETKSTAGDKYETGRAMLHIEQDQVRQQMAELMRQKAVLDALDPDSLARHAGPGSLLKMGGAFYYLSIGLGRLKMGEQRIIALSAQSPLGKQLMGKEPGDKILMNGQPVSIEEIN